jgi:hypothetical protein
MEKQLMKVFIVMDEWQQVVKVFDSKEKLDSFIQGEVLMDIDDHDNEDEWVEDGWHIFMQTGVISDEILDILGFDIQEGEVQ